MSETVRVTRDGAILEVVLDRPKANAIDSAAPADDPPPP